MTTAIIGTGSIGSTIARQLAAGGEDVRLSSTSAKAAEALATDIGARAVGAAGNRDAVQGADAVVLALWLKDQQAVIGEIADLLPGKLVVETTNPIAVDAEGNVTRTLPEGQSSAEVVAGWLPSGVHFAKAFSSLPADLLAASPNREPQRAVLFYTTDDEAAGAKVEQLIDRAGFDPVRAGTISASGRIEVGGDLHPYGGLEGRVVDRSEASSLVAAAN
jgi:predicted dinucleotide-binding enzyme